MVQDSKLLGHVFAIQDETPWSYMISITQVIDDIQETLLACTIELPVLGRPHRGDSPLLCAKVSRSHHSLTAFGLTRCPICEEDLSELATAQEGGYWNRNTLSHHEKLGIDKPVVEEAAMQPASKASQTSPPGDLDDDGFRASELLNEVPCTIDYIDGNDFDESDNSSTELEIPMVASIHSSTDMKKSTASRLGQFTKSDSSVPTLGFGGLKKAHLLRYGRKKSHVELHIFLRRFEPWKQSSQWKDLNDTKFRVVNTIFNIDDSANSDIHATTVTICGASIKRALRSIILYYPSVRLKTKSPVKISEPYPVLLHHMDQLDDYMNQLRHHTKSGKQEEKQRIEHNGIEILWAFTRHISCQAYVQAEIARHLRNACTFRMLWLLYKPGTTVYHMDDDEDYSALVIRSVDVGKSILRSPLDSIEPYTVYLWRLDFDGHVVGRSTHTIRITPFEGEREIIKLKVFPCDFLDKLDEGRTRARLEERGRRWYELLRGGAMHYQGLSLDYWGQNHVRKAL